MTSMEFSGSLWKFFHVGDGYIVAQGPGQMPQRQHTDGDEHHAEQDRCQFLAILSAPSLKTANR